MQIISLKIRIWEVSVMKREWGPKCQAVQNVNITKTENTDKDK